MLDTDALTSGYGLSSSSIASKSSSILRGEKENGFSDVVDDMEGRNEGGGGVKKGAEGCQKLDNLLLWLRASSQEALTRIRADRRNETQNSLDRSFPTRCVLLQHARREAHALRDRRLLTFGLEFHVFHHSSIHVV